MVMMTGTLLSALEAGNITFYTRGWEHYFLHQRLGTVLSTPEVGNITFYTWGWEHYFLHLRLGTLLSTPEAGNSINPRLCENLMAQGGPSQKIP